jgi:hypothetical protein
MSAYLGEAHGVSNDDGRFVTIIADENYELKSLIEKDGQLEEFHGVSDYRLEDLRINVFEKFIVTRESLMKYLREDTIDWGDSNKKEFLKRIYLTQQLSSEEFKQACIAAGVKPKEPKYEFHDRDYTNKEVRMCRFNQMFLNNIILKSRNERFKVWK